MDVFLNPALNIKSKSYDNRAKIICGSQKADICTFKGTETQSLSVEELEQFKTELQDFYNKDILSRIKPAHPPAIKFEKPGMFNIISNKDFIAVYSFPDNIIAINTDFLTNPDVYKLVDKSGKCLKNPNIKVSMIGSKQQLEKAIEYFKDGQIEKLTKSDRKNLIKSYLYHETVHSKQFDLMRKTEGLGSIKLLQTDNINLNYLISYNLIYKPRCKKTWSKFSNEEGTIPQNSPDGIKAYGYYNDLTGYTLNIKDSTYYKVSFEQEAYDEQEKFTKETNLDF